MSTLAYNLGIHDEKTVIIKKKFKVQNILSRVNPYSIIMNNQ